MADTDHLRLLTETAATMDPADETCPTPMSLPVAELQPQDPQTVQPEPQQNDEPLTPTGSTDTTTTTATTIGQPNETDSPMLATKKMRAEDGSAIPTSFVTETTPSKGADARQRETVPRAVAVSPFSTATATDPKVQQIDALRDPNTSQISAENMPVFIKLISNDGFASTLDIRTELLMSVLSTKDPQSLSM